MKPSEVLRCVLDLRARYPATKLGPDATAAYCTDLCDLEADRLVAAIVIHAKTSRFFPTIAELRALADHEPAAELALAEVVRACRLVGRNRVPQWSHPSIAEAVVQMGGWQEVCSDTSDGRVFLRAYKGRNERRIEAAHRLAASPHLKLVGGDE